MPKLTYTLDGEEHTVEVQDSCSIGRAPTNDVPLESEAGASRRHVQIMKLARSYELSDLGSTNGTKVNGKKVQRHRLEHGDKIEIGETALVWKEREDDDEIDLEEEIALDGPSPKKKKKAAATGEQSYLVFAGGDRDGDRIQLDKARTTFGRRSSNTIVIESQAVSGYHCEITREGGSYVLRDLGSTNGTMLDGDPVGEIALQHGGRIRVGDQLLVFVDPSISDFEKAMAAVDDLGTEWGMLRAEMDMTRVQRARRSQVVAVVAMVAVIGVIGYVFIANPELLEEQKPTIATIDGNVVPDFSFEDVSGGWTAAEGSPATGAYGDGEDAAQGSSFYTVSRDGSGGRPAVFELTGEEFTISPGRTYAFGAQARTSGGARAAVRLLWIGAGEGAVGSRLVSTGLADGSGWTELVAQATPPPDTTHARLQLVNAGPGSADFDDVFLRPAEGRSAGAEASDGSVKVAATSAGAVRVERDNDVLLEDVRIVGGALGGAIDRGEIPARAGTASISSVAAEGGAVRVRGSVYDPYANEAADFDVSFAVSEGRYVDITGSLPETAALVGLVPEHVIDKGVGVWTGGTSFRESQSRSVPAAERVSVGSSKRYEISSPAGAFRFALSFDGASHAVALGASDGSLALRIDVDTRALDSKRGALQSAAQAAEAQGRNGEAAKLYRDYASEFPEGSAQQDDARRKAEMLAAAGETRLARLEETAKGAIAYGDVPALRMAADEAQALQDGYGLAAAGEVRERVRAALAERAKTRAQAMAEPQLARAADHLKGDRKGLAQALYRDVVERFPGTEAAAQAQQALQGLGE